jgi:hypothetical protein
MAKEKTIIQIINKDKEIQIEIFREVQTSLVKKRIKTLHNKIRNTKSHKYTRIII